jgi:hypothetical protein
MFSKDTKEGLLLILVYCGILAVATVICAFVGYEIDELFGSGIGVTLSIFAFFGACWFSWVLAVRVTEPRAAEQQQSKGPRRSSPHPCANLSTLRHDRCGRATVTLVAGAIVAIFPDLATWLTRVV